MATLQPVRGTHDLLPSDMRAQRHVMDTAQAIALLYGFEEMTPPVFEFTDVFQRTLGDTSDIVTKEMYTFDDRGGDSITLRPEFTAGIARAFMSNGLQQAVPVKFFARGPVFRYERPQKGRLRQFHQVDVEILGVPGPQADIEVIAVGAHLLKALGISADVKLEINTLGDTESRQHYRDTLVAYLNGHKSELSEDSLNRLEKNPLRIFDSKDEGDRSVMADAPLLSEHLNDHSRQFFDAVLLGLADVGVETTINRRLVRGLDYYSHTAFEFVTDKLGAQGAVLAGGRYDGLMEQMGGKPTPGIGWAAGVERLAMMVGEPVGAVRPIAVIPVGDAASRTAIIVAQTLREAGYHVDLGYSGNMGKRMKRADKLNAVAAVLLGDDELARKAATVRDMQNGEQAEVPLSELREHLARYR
ncbi:MAG: histidine--tRNA ligase [Rhodospirillales bacterium]